MLKFNKNLDWLKESDKDDNLLADDELDTVEEEMNEGLYVDPSNYDKHNDLVDVVDKAGNPQKMTQATYDKNKDSGEFEKKEPGEKEVKVGEKVDARDLKEGNSYVTKEDMYYGDVEEFDGIYDIDELKKKGFVKDNEVVIPAGTKLNYEGSNGGAYTFDINGEEFDLSLDDIDLYSAEEPEKKEQKFNRDSAKAYIDDITQDTEDDGVTIKKDYYSKKLDYSGDLRNPENWPTSVNDIFSHQYKIRHKLYDQFKDYATTDAERKENEKYRQQYDDVYDDVTQALKNTDEKERFDMINSYYKNADYASDESGAKTAKIKHILQSFDYDINNKKDMRAAYKDLKQKLG